MSIPLAIRVGDVHVTRKVDDLQLRSNVNGFAEAGFNLAVPLSADFDPFTKVTVFDGPDIVWEGRLEDPGRAVGADGEQWDMSAIGEQARASDRAAALIYIDTDLSRWLREALTSAPSADAGVSEVPTTPGTDGLLLQFNPGQPIDNNSGIFMRYRAIAEVGMEIGGIEYSAVSGITNANFNYRMRALDAADTATALRTDNYSAVPVSRSATLSDDPPVPAGTKTIELAGRRAAGGATNVTSDDNWAAFYDIVVKGVRYNLDGTPHITGADYAPGRWVYAHEVIRDLLARLLSAAYDVPNADIDSSSAYAIPQLAYPDGVTAEQLLADLMEMEPNFYWQVGPSNPANGKATFTWRKWPTTARYTASLKDGLSIPGADAERYNRVTIRWKDKRGRIKTSTYSAGTTISGAVVPAVPELDAQGLTREPEVQDLGDEIGSQAAADKLAAEFLLAHGTPPVSGTLHIARKIYDADTGRMVAPWEIQPGHLIRIRELADTHADLVDTGRDGKCVFRIVGASYTASDNTVELELDAPPRTDEVLLAQQINKRNRKR